MYAEYLGRDLYNKINKLIGKVFYKVYTKSDDNWFDIDAIRINYSTVESDTDLPFVEVDVRCGTTFDGDYKITLEFALEETDDFNAGVFYSTFVNHEDE
jgi:hypothetical protein